MCVRRDGANHLNHRKSFMQNMLVTGGCGFIGSNFVRFLFEEVGFAGRVINFDKLTYAADPESLADVAARHADRYVLVRADICDRAAVRDAFRKYRIDTVCHFAAESHVDRSIAAPDAFVKTNFEGTFYLLEAAREHGGGLHRFHHVSTDEVYGSLGAEGRFTEDTPYRPQQPVLRIEGRLATTWCAPTARPTACR